MHGTEVNCFNMWAVKLLLVSTDSYVIQWVCIYIILIAYFKKQNILKAEIHIFVSRVHSKKVLYVNLACMNFDFLGVSKRVDKACIVDLAMINPLSSWDFKYLMVAYTKCFKPFNTLLVMFYSVWQEYLFVS